MYYIKKEFWLSCSHKLFDKQLTDEENKIVFGACNNYHGHNYKVIITLKSTDLIYGMVANFQEIKAVFKEKVNDIYDHTDLNKKMKNLPTAENITKLIYDIFKKEFPDKIYSVEVFETDSCSAFYKEELAEQVLKELGNKKVHMRDYFRGEKK